MIVQLAGLVSLDGQAPQPARVEAMLDALNPRRGPERRWLASDGRACFAAVAVGPAAEAAESPLRQDDRGLFAADAVLWDPAPLAPTGSGETVEGMRRAVLWKGGEVSAALHGDFAWALWDGSALQLARDHFGIRPLCYTVRPGRWAAFASHPDALLETGLARPALDRDSALNITVLEAPVPGRHFQADVAVVPPGHLVEVTADGRARARRYWRLPIGPRIDRRTGPAEVAAEGRRLLVQAVQRRLPRAGPVASHLSGGIDSSTIAAVAARAIRPEGRTLLGYSFEEPLDALDFPLVDEAPFVAQVVAAEPNIRLTAVSDPGWLEPILGPYALSLLYPFNARDPEHRVLEHAASNGADRVFSGWGGDQIVSYAVHEPIAELVLHGRWRTALAELRKQKARLPVAVYYRIVLALLPERLRLAVERATGRGYPPRPVLQHFRLPGVADPPMFPYPLPPPGRTFLSRREMTERNWIQHRLALFSQMGAPFGIRYVFPLLDLDLVRFAMQVPGYYLLRDGYNRRLLRDAAQGLLPETVRLREEKLFPHTLEAIRFPRLKRRFMARLAEIPPDGLAASLVDVPRLARELDARLGTPEETLEQLRAAAARGEQLDIPAFDLLKPLKLAFALDEYERRWGRAAWPDGGTA